MNNQDTLRKKARLAKALNDEYTFKDFAEIINLTEGSFYNWLSGSQELSYKKYKYLEDFIICLLDE